MNIAQNLERSCRLFPDKPALIFAGRSFSYSEMDTMSNRLANRLDGLGIVRGDRVALLLPNGPAFVFAYFGILKLGAVAVAINTGLKTEELAYILEDSGARAVIATAELNVNMPAEMPSLQYRLLAESEFSEAFAADRPAIQAAPAFEAVHLRADEPSAILYTSGTTGFPKGATLSHGGVILNGQACMDALHLRPADRVLLCLPIFHSYAQNAAFNPTIAVGATVVLQSQADVDAMRRAFVEEQVTVFFGIPVLYTLLQEKVAKDELRSLRLCISAATSLPAKVECQWQETFGLPIHDGYGLTETLHNSYNPDPQAKPGSAGLPLQGVEVAIFDGEGKLVGEPGGLGEVAIRGPNVMLGYWNRPDATAEVLREGWFHTGDIGRVDAEGYLYIVDRAKDMVNVAGMKVYPSEVEAVLHRHPAVAEAAVYAVSDALLGEQARASVVLRPGLSADAEELQAFCYAHLADFKIPSSIEFSNALPRSRSGKVLKRLLRDRLQTQASPSTSTSPESTKAGVADIAAWIIRWLHQTPALATDAIDPHRPFAEYGMTSLLAVNLARDLGAWLGHPLPPTIAWNFPTVAALAGNAENHSESVAAAIQPVPRDRHFPLSFIQEEVWWRCQSPNLSDMYHLLPCVRLTGTLDVEVLRQSLNVLAIRHESLRTTFPVVQGAPVQAIAPESAVDLTVMDWRASTEAAQSSAIDRLIIEELQRPFDLAQGPLWRVTLLQLAGESYLLPLAVHHIIVDAQSVYLLFNDLAAIYPALLDGHPIDLPSLPIHYADFAHWQRRTFTPDALASHQQYWQGLWATPPPPLDLPTDWPRPPEHAEQTYAGGSERFELAPDLTRQLQDLSRQQGVTLYMTLMAAYAALLYRYSHCDDIVIGAPTSKRTQPGLEALVGHFAGRSWLRINLAGVPPFTELLGRVKQAVLAAFDHQELTFRQWQRTARTDWQPSHPVRPPRALFNFYPPGREEIKLNELTLALIPTRFERILSDLTMILWEAAQPGSDPALQGLWRYRRDLFKPVTIARMVADFQRLLEAIVADPAQPVDSLPTFLTPPANDEFP